MDTSSSSTTTLYLQLQLIAPRVNVCLRCFGIQQDSDKFATHVLLPFTQLIHTVDLLKHQIPESPQQSEATPKVTHCKQLRPEPAQLTQQKRLTM